MAALLVTKISERLADAFLSQRGQNVNLMKGTQAEVEKISEKLMTIRRLLPDVERRKLKEEAVQIWLEKLDDIACEIDDVLDEWNYEIDKRRNQTTWEMVRSFILHFCCCFKDVSMHHPVASTLKALNGKLELICKQADEFKFVISSSPSDSLKPSGCISITSIVSELEVFGRESDKDAIVSHLVSESSSQNDEAVLTVSIVGIGGIGKTTLARLVFNDQRVRSHFKRLRKWICLSDLFDDERTANKLLESHGKNSCRVREFDMLLQRIRNSFSGKKFLLILDDVCMEDDTKLTLIRDSFKDGSSGSRILVTTRNERVARMMGTKYVHHLKQMSDLDCWEILSRRAFQGKTKESSEKVEKIGKRITKKCNGSPLAAKILGGVLHFKDTVQEWQDILDSKLWELDEESIELFPHLYLSYQELPTEVKPCFKYCAVLPKNLKIDVDELSRQWLGQGYLGSSKRGELPMEEKGREYFNILASTCFFRDLKKDFLDGRVISCKIHDVVHDFVQYLMKNECLLLKQVDCKGNLGRVHHLRWLRNRNEETISSLVRDAGKLRCFLATGSVPQDWFSCLKSVRTLSLSACSLVELPTEIGNLIHLRYLNLSRNHLEELPGTICNLYYLETLDISSCEDLRQLPQRIENLVHLRHLLNIDTFRLYDFPRGLETMNWLRSLSNVKIGTVYLDWKSLKNLNQLHGFMHIQIFDIIGAENAKLQDKQYLQNLVLEFNTSDSTIDINGMESLQPPPNLKKLTIRKYPGNLFPDWMETSLNNLRVLHIIEAQNVCSLPALGKLSSLEELKIVGMHLFFIGREFLGFPENFKSTSDLQNQGKPKLVAFPMLKILVFSDLPVWHSWEDIGPGEENGVLVMPCLQHLALIVCNDFCFLPHRMLRMSSSLKSVTIR